MGMAGSGKTVLVQTLISTVRKMFQFRRAALVCAPTGAAAFNSGGITIHSLCGINPKNAQNLIISSSEKEKLQAEIEDTVLLFIDERGMTGFKSLEKAERAIAQSTRDGRYSDKSWGNLPVVVLIGDDKQLPSVDKGTLYMPVGPLEDRPKDLKLSTIEAKGQVLFLEAAKDVMVLGTIKRQDESEKDYMEALQGLRDDTLTVGQYKFLEHFHLQQNHWTRSQIDKIMDGASFAFSTRREVKSKNLDMLARISGPSNPVAKIQCCYPITRDKSGKAIASHFKGDESPTVSLLCIGAQVAISGKNFLPSWGLYNGAVGTVVSIVYPKGKTPNNGDLPAYMVVDFPCYIGEVWDSEHPKVSFEQ